MINPHPPLSGFPVTICFIIACCEVFKHLFKKQQLSTVCNYLSFFGLVLFPLVYYSGYKGSSFVDPNFNQELIESHQNVAKLFLFTCIPYLVLRTAVAFEKNLLGMISDYAKEVIETILTCFSIAILALAIYTNHIGGNLVFEHGAGVSKAVLKSTEIDSTEANKNTKVNKK